jgi:uncharacterized membrane protein YhaH (DUF805 family)
MYLSIFDYMKTKQNFHIIRFSFSDNPVLMEFQVMWEISLCNNWTRIFWPRCSIIGRSIRDIQYPGWIEWSIFSAIMAIGFGLEYVHRLREGTCGDYKTLI